jgi:hypothetical protein
MYVRYVAFLVVAAAGLGAVATAVILNSATTAAAQADRNAAVVEPSERPLLEGPIHYAVYERENGKIGGFTRINDAKAVPGGNGSWNDHCYGKLYREYLIVTKPSNKNWGVLVLPANRLHEVHFAQE